MNNVVEINPKFDIGQIVKPFNNFPLRGVVYDVDPCFNNDRLIDKSVPKDISVDQPYYYIIWEENNILRSPHTLEYVAEDRLAIDNSGDKVKNTLIKDLFGKFKSGKYQPKTTRH